MAFTRLDIRNEIRDLIQETSGITGAIYTDAVLNRQINRELLSLPKKDIYIEESWQATLDPTVDYSNGLALPSGTVKVESVERNDGTSTYPVWHELLGVDNYSGAIFFPFVVSTSQNIRVKIKKTFTLPTDDVTALDIPDDKTEVLVWGVIVRSYRIMIGNLRGSQSFDSVTNPGGVTISVLQAWLRDAEKTYQDLIQEYATVPRPRDIDLIS